MGWRKASARLSELQEELYARSMGRAADLQAMDAAGKDGTIKTCHVGRESAGLPVTSFKRRRRRNWTIFHVAHDPAFAPSGGGGSGYSTARIMRKLLVVRVHPEFLPGESCAITGDEGHLDEDTRTSTRSSAT